jgi:hypothetical protein
MFHGKYHPARIFLCTAVVVVALGPLAGGQVGKSAKPGPQRDLPYDSNGYKGIVYFSRLPEAKVFDLRSWEYTRVDLAKPGRVDVVLFLSASDPLSSLQVLPGLKSLSQKYPPDEMSEIFCFVRTDRRNAIVLANSGLFGETAQLYWDRSDELDRLVGVPPQTPFGAVVEGGTRRLIVPLNGNPAYVGTVEKFVKWEVSKHGQ